VKLVADDLFTTRDTTGRGAALIGGRSASSGVTTFPYQHRCPKTGADDMERVELPRRGTLWSWTVQGFEPKRPPYDGPSPFEPYGVGYVELGGVVRVEGRLTVADPTQLRIGMEMEVTTMSWRNGAGDDVMTYAFAPVEGN
jgi:uncharacterized protein